MAPEFFIQRGRSWYAKLVRLYPKAHRDRFAEEMQQTFHDLCRERVQAGRGLFGFALWIFGETSAGIIRENATNIMRCSMKQDSATFLKFLKHSGIAVSTVMLAGIVALMILSRGKGEDITGIVAPALLLTMISSIVAIVAAVLQKRARQAIDTNGERLS